MSNTAHDKNLEELEYLDTKKGVRLDLRLYVYPDGHGNIYIEKQGKLYQNYPARSKEVANDVFAGIWNRACELSSKPERMEQHAELTPELIAWLETVGISPRPPVGAIALQQMMKLGEGSSTEMADAVVAERDM